MTCEDVALIVLSMPTCRLSGCTSYFHTHVKMRGREIREGDEYIFNNSIMHNEIVLETRSTFAPSESLGPEIHSINNTRSVCFPGLSTLPAFPHQSGATKRTEITLPLAKTPIQARRLYVIKFTLSYRKSLPEALPGVD